MYGGPESLDALQLKKTPANRKKKNAAKAHKKSQIQFNNSYLKGLYNTVR